MRSDSGVSVTVLAVRSTINDPMSGRGGGSSSGVPTQICTPWISPSDIWTTSVRITRSFLGVMLVKPLRARAVSPMALWMAIKWVSRRRNVVIGTKSLVWAPCATTAGSLPSVSTSSQSWVIALIVPMGRKPVGDEVVSRSAMSTLAYR